MGICSSLQRCPHLPKTFFIGYNRHMQAGAVTQVDCKSCGTKNSSDMSFCIQCGKVLSSSVEALRQARGVKKRSCRSCGRSDELNNRYCVFCGAEIEIYQGRHTNAEALAKFSDELHSMEPAPAPGPAPTSSFTSLPALEPVQSAPVPARAGVDLFLIFGIVAGLALPFVIGGASLAQLALALQVPAEGLILYTEKPNARVLLESLDRTCYILGQTSRHGVFYAKDLPADGYRLRLSLPESRTLMQKIDLVKGKLNCLGFEKPIRLPRLPGAAAKEASK